MNIVIGDAPLTFIAFMDTGAPYLVVGPELIEALELRPTAPAARIELSTRRGPKNGFLDNIEIELPAEGGESLRFGVTVFACEEWPDGIFLGYQGCMANINFAVQPQANQFFFGPATA